MNFYQLICGFLRHDDAQDYADKLPPEAKAKVVPYSTGRDDLTGQMGHAFAVDVHRNYISGRM